jgi:hypothetical protein
MKTRLSIQTRKCLEVQLGSAAAHEIYNLINSMYDEINRLNESKVDKTFIAPVSSEPIKSPRYS